MWYFLCFVVGAVGGFYLHSMLGEQLSEDLAIDLERIKAELKAAKAKLK